MRQHDWHSEDGAYAVMFVAVFLVLTLLVAFVADLGAMRYDRRNSKSVADMSATAAAATLDESFNAQDACEDAWAYVVRNLLGPSAPIPASPCGSVAPFCNPATGTAGAATGQVGDYDVVITIGVVDNHPNMRPSQPVVPEIDGTPCNRAAVELTHTRGFVFTGLVSASSAGMGAASVARAHSGDLANVFPALVILEPYDCEALYVQGGQANVLVKSSADDPGVINVDSSGFPSGGFGSNCGPPKPYVLDVGNSNNSFIHTEGPGGGPGFILQYALWPGSNIPRAYRPPSPANQLKPNPPQPFHRTTREPWDHRYDCKSGYPDYLGIPIPDCTDTAVAPAAITNFKAARACCDDLTDATVRVPADGTPPGGKYWSYLDYVEQEYLLTGAAACAIPNGTDIEIPRGRWYIDCPRTGGNQNQGGFELNQNVTATFEGGDLVFTGQVRVESNPSTLRIGETGDPTTVFIRRRDTNAANKANDLIASGQNTKLELHHTMVLLEDGVTDTSTQTDIVWSAPRQDGYEFDYLSLWSESSVQHSMGGQGQLEVSGTFFAPYADPFRFQGQSGVGQPQDAQFVVRKLLLQGGSYLEMQPNPQDATPVQLQGVRLIR